MSKSTMERLRSGERIDIELSDNDYEVVVTASRAVIRGCDCSNTLTVEEARQVHDALGAFIRINREETG